MIYSQEEMDRLQKFQARLNSEPPFESIEATPDKRASTVVISHVEMTLDELFFGQWSTENFRSSHIANEVQASLELVVVHPVSGKEIRRVGAASVVITVDKVPDSIKDDPQQRNQWALSVSNKKPNALDLAYPKLKAECLKNAALSLGKIFGRDLNRRIKDDYRPFKLNIADTGLAALPESTMSRLENDILDPHCDEYQIREALTLMAELITPEQQIKIDSLFKQREAHE